MAGAVHIPDEAETRVKWSSFAFSPAYKAKADVFIGRYPAGRQQSAVMALLDLAQRQVGEQTQTQGWLPVPVIEYVADYLDNDAVIAEYLTAAAEDPNADVFLAALGDVAKARGMARIARQAGLGRESLYKALGSGAHPRFETVSAVLRALGVKLTLVAEHRLPRRKAPLRKAPPTRSAPARRPSKRAGLRSS